MSDVERILAAVTIDGTVWGFGATEEEALDDAQRWLTEGEDPGYVYTGVINLVEITGAQAIQISEGEVNCRTLGIEVPQ